LSEERDAMTAPIGRALRTLAALALPLAAAPAAAHEGWGVAVDAHGRVYVADIPANTVWRISPDGRSEPVVRGVHSHALVVGPDGAVYGTDVHLTRPVRGVWRLDMSGRLSYVLPPTESLPLDLQPFLLSAKGTIYSASPYRADLPAHERRLFLLRRRPDGAVDTVAGGPLGHADGVGTAARFEAIEGMAWLPDGDILVADGPRLRRVTLKGGVETLGEALTERRFGEGLMGVAVGPDGALYAADFARGAVRRVVEGLVEEVVAGGPYWSPTGVAATAAGVYVLEHPRAPLGLLGDLGVGPYLRVRRRAPDGTVTVLTTRWGRHTAEAAGALAAVVLLGAGALLATRRRRGGRRALTFALPAASR
jgi:hypothetical protein